MRWAWTEWLKAGLFSLYFHFLNSERETILIINKLTKKQKSCYIVTPRRGVFICIIHIKKLPYFGKNRKKVSIEP
jgi:hypothetical protein